MLQTIEVEIDHSGRIHPLEPLSFMPTGRAYLTLLPSSNKSSSVDSTSGSASQILKLLTTARFSKRPVADPDEVQQRILALRNEWNDQ